MYNAFFGFKEKPFKLVPDPEFLFLGKSHEEALAHLTYATTQGDGFVEITGEVGTGKTTLCRVFLENLDPSVEAAFIFNTNLDPAGLLRAINTELSLDATPETTTELLEILNRFLLENSRQGRSVILLIDEAQNLGIETLEQLRMLSNLETTKNKLMQIILVGQPELGELLNSLKLRQLGQRINLSCCLLPMTIQETREYINHRVNMASQRAASLFTPSAQKAIYNYSRGIPRLINIACDRSLVIAYSLDRPKVTKSTAKLAILELSARGQGHTPSPNPKRFILPGVLFLVIVLMVIFEIFPVNMFPVRLLPVQLFSKKVGTTVSEDISMSISPQKIQAADPGSQRIKTSANSFSPKPGPVDPAPPQKHSSIEHFLAQSTWTATRENALSRVISIWKKEPVVPIPSLVNEIFGEYDFFRMAALEQGFEVLLLENDFSMIEILNLPVILPFILPSQTKINQDKPDQNKSSQYKPDLDKKGYLLISGITTDKEWIIEAGDNTNSYRTAPGNLLPFLTGKAYLLYREKPGQSGVISERSPETQILSLKLLLRKLEFPGIDPRPKYDDKVRQAIKKVQLENGLTVDGLAGPMTRIVLYNKNSSFSAPWLRKANKQ